jgi:hypothetical protein
MLRRLGRGALTTGGLGVPQRSSRRRSRVLIAIGVMSSLVASMAVVAPAPILAATPTPVAEWTFDEGTGATAHDSIGNLDGTLSSGASWITSGTPQGSGAIAFDGTANGVITIANDAALEPSSDFSISLWVRNSDVMNNPAQELVQKGFYGCDTGGSWGIREGAFNAEGTAYLDAWGYQWVVSSGGPRAFDDEWHLVMMVLDDTNDQFRMWVDGIKRTGSFPIPDHVQFGSTGRLDDALLIGGPGAGCDYLKPYDGAIDDLRIYDGALSDEQVLALTPLVDTTTVLVVEQYGTQISSAYNDAPTVFVADIRPRPGLPGTVTIYASSRPKAAGRSVKGPGRSRPARMCSGLCGKGIRTGQPRPPLP